MIDIENMEWQKELWPWTVCCGYYSWDHGRIDNVKGYIKGSYEPKRLIGNYYVNKKQNKNERY